MRKHADDLEYTDEHRAQARTLAQASVVDGAELRREADSIAEKIADTRDDAAAYRVQINELGVGIRAGLQDPNLGRNPRLPLAIRAAAWATINCPVLWRKVCRTMLKDRR